MKKIISISLLILTTLGIFVGCKRTEAKGFFKEPPSTATTLLFDNTEKMKAKPNEEEIVKIFDFKSEDVYNGYSLRVRRLSSINLTTVSNIELRSQNKFSGDERKRIALIKGFRKQVQAVIDSLSIEKVRDEGTSVIYRTLAQELNYLSKVNADKKICIIYSDMIENSLDANFYSPSALAELRRNSKVTIDRLQGIVPLGNLKGIQVYIVYQPKSYEQEVRFGEVIKMYRKMLEAKGATLTVGANLVLPTSVH